MRFFSASFLLPNVFSPYLQFKTILSNQYFDRVLSQEIAKRPMINLISIRVRTNLIPNVHVPHKLFSFHQEKDLFGKKGMSGRRSTSLRQARSPQISLELPSLHSPGTNAFVGSNQASIATMTPKKSNWEVIEHFNSAAEKGRGSVSSSLIAVSCGSM